MSDLRIVLLERDDLARELYTEYLVGEGYRVRAEALFDDALAAVKKTQTPLLVAGIAPGTATVAQIAAAVRRASPTTTVLALLAREAAEGGLRAVRDGALEALTKPVSAEALALGVRRCLATAQLLAARPAMRRQIQTYNNTRRIQRAVDEASIVELLVEATLATTGADGAVVIRPGTPAAVVAARGLEEAPASELATGLDWAARAADPAVLVDLPGGGPPPRGRGKPLALLRLLRVGTPAAPRLHVALAYGPKAHATHAALADDERATRASELELYAEQAAFALDMLARYPDGGQDGAIDPLTDLVDARSLVRSLAHELELARKGDRRLALLHVQLDALPELTATHGELVARQVVVEASRLLTRTVRDVDLVARAGDDRFAVLLTTTDAGGGARAAERLRAVFASHRFLAREGLDLSVALRLGVAGFPEDGASAEALMAHATAVAAAPVRGAPARKRAKG